MYKLVNWNKDHLKMIFIFKNSFSLLKYIVAIDF